MLMVRDSCEVVNVYESVYMVVFSKRGNLVGLTWQLNSDTLLLVSNVKREDDFFDSISHSSS